MYDDIINTLLQIPIEKLLDYLDFHKKKQKSILIQDWEKAAYYRDEERKIESEFNLILVIFPMVQSEYWEFIESYIKKILREEKINSIIKNE